MQTRTQIAGVLIGCALLLFAHFFLGCTGKGVDWPTFVKCEAPAAAGLLDAVTKILLREEDPAKSLEDLAVTYGPAAVACAVDELLPKFAARGVNDWATAQRQRALDRGRAFLAAKGVREVRR